MNDDLISRSALEMSLQETNIRIAVDKGKMFNLIQSAPAVDAIPRSDLVAELERFRVSLADVVLRFLVNRVIEIVKAFSASEV